MFLNYLPHLALLVFFSILFFYIPNGAHELSLATSPLRTPFPIRGKGGTLATAAAEEHTSESEAEE